MRVLVTGATGFVGGAVVRELAPRAGLVVRAAVRRPVAELRPNVEQARVADLDGATSWADAVRDVDVVVHAAARVHVMSETAVDPLAEFRRVNVAGTLNLARQAVRAGVRRFVFVSSIKVNGEETMPGRPYTGDDEPAPVDAYGLSKREAEDGLHVLARETGLELVVIRPVLVYGPGVKGNFRTLVDWLRRGVPLPLGSIRNARSLVALANLVDLIRVAMEHPAAAGETFLVSDGEDVSTPALLRRTAAALGTRARLIPVPPALLETAARLLGRADVARRLCGSLQVDITKTRQRLRWSPPVSLDTGLAQAVRGLNESSH